MGGTGILIGGPHATVVVGGSVGSGGEGGVGIGFEAGGIFDPASPQGIVQTILVAPGGEILDSSMGNVGGARVYLKPGLAQALDLTNHGSHCRSDRRPGGRLCRPGRQHRLHQG